MNDPVALPEQMDRDALQMAYVLHADQKTVGTIDIQMDIDIHRHPGLKRRKQGDEEDDIMHLEQYIRSQLQKAATIMATLPTDAKCIMRTLAIEALNESENLQNRTFIDILDYLDNVLDDLLHKHPTLDEYDVVTIQSALELATA
jgi:hypothetical protein